MVAMVISACRALSGFGQRGALLLQPSADRAEGGEKVVQRPEQVVVGQAVVHELAALVALDKARVLENLEVFRERRLGHVEPRGDLAGGGRWLRKGRENPAAGGA